MSQLNLGKVVGRGVQSFSKTKTEGLTDTYTMAYTDGTSTAVEITHNSKNNYTDSAVAEVAKIATKVDKVDGKGLSTNDLTNELKASYDGAVEGVATVNGTIDNLAYSDTAGGKNLINIDLIKLIRYKYINDNGEEMSLSGANYTNNFYKVKPNTVYTWTGNKTNSTNINGGVYFYNNSKVFVSRSTGFTNSPTTFTTPSNCEYIRLQIGGGETFDYTNFQIEKGTTATDYKPYIPSVKTLAKKVNDDLKMLGWTVPAECPIQNYTDSDGVFHQRVGRVDLGNADYSYYSTYGFRINNIEFGSSDIVCSEYPNRVTSSWNAYQETLTSGNTYFLDTQNKLLYLANGTYTDATAFKQAMSGVYLYYELATEITKKVDGNEVVVDTFRDSAPAHNGIFRGKDLTNIYSIDEICSRISDGTFRDLYIGDYFDITIDGEGSEVVRCVLAGFDTYLHNGDTSFERHHAVVVTKNCLTTIHSMNSTNTTAGGYLGSDMWTTVLPIYNTAFGTVLGDHLLSHRTILTNTVSTTGNSNAGAGFTGYSSGWTWADAKLSLLSEIQVYGSNVFSSSFYDTGNENLQLPLFALDPTAKVCSRGGITNTSSSNRQWYWLRNVASGTHFAFVLDHGGSDYGDASIGRGVRPLFCIG